MTAENIAVKMFMYSIALFATIITNCFCVPSQPTPTDHLKNDIETIKETIEDVSDQLQKWNLLYISQVEPRIVTSATTLAVVDNNIRNIQERAHVWDNFQLHVAAWNDQLSTSDRKLDIISKGQEKLLTLEDKLNSITNMESKIDIILKKLETTEHQLSSLDKQIEYRSQCRENLFGEFATRGILSALKVIEQKLDKIQVSTENVDGNLNLIQLNEDNTKQNWSICNTSLAADELLQDVASKVDIIFDKISSSEESDEDSEEEYTDEKFSASTPQPNSEVLSRNASQSRLKLRKVLDLIQDDLTNINSNTLKILEYHKSDHNRCKNCAAVVTESNYNELMKNIENIIESNFTKTQENIESILYNQFLEQKMFLQSILADSNTRLICPESGKVPGMVDVPLIEEFEAKGTIVVYTKNVSSCEELEYGDQSGVYMLGSEREINPAGRDYKTRYCEVQQNSTWTVIQRRDNYLEQQNFTLDWNSYKNGFGSLNEDFWFGNDFIFNMSHERDLMLRIELEDFDGNTAWAEYLKFVVDSEVNNYRLTVGGYSGNSSDALSIHNNSLFSTFDKKNDDTPECCPCAESYGGGWWFNSCFGANLNGVYHQDPLSNEYFRGIIWETWLGNYSLKKSVMMVKPRTTEYFGEENVANKTLSTQAPYLEDP